MTKIEAMELELAARKMVAGTALGWVEVLRLLKLSPVCRDLEAYDLHDIELAIGIVEGKPVWKGDTLYLNENNFRIVAKHPNCDSLLFRNELGELIGMPLRYWSLNPSNPKTVMVELLVKDAEYFGSLREGMFEETTRFYKACRKALEKLK